jgi:hypothetical protein
VSLYLECLGESVLERLRKLHTAYDSTGATRSALMTVFGPPEQCLVCAAPLHWETRDRIPNDVDPWFCGNCCPICDSGAGDASGPA